MNRENVSWVQTNLVVGLILVVMLFSACDKDTGKANLKVTLIDAPASYQEVNIDIKEVQINSGDVDTGFVSLDMETIGVVNLLELTGGFEAILSDSEIPVGRINQIRLILGDNNTLKVDEKIVDLTIPGGSTSGLKVNVGIDVVEGESYKIVLDFDASKSIVKAGNSGKYNLKPVIRTIIENDINGRIVGKVNPKTLAKVSAIWEKDTINTYTNSDGVFDFKGLNSGNYTVVILPDSLSGFANLFIFDITVVANEKTDVGIIELK